MIKFFRKIRQKLLSENKFSKYLIYAIGEIILVVVGILIALQFNTWQIEKKDRKIEKTLLKNIKRDLESDIQEFRHVKEFKISQNKSGLRLLEYIIDTSKPLEDTLQFINDFQLIVYFIVPSSNRTSFDIATSTGYLNNITNDSLTKDLSNYFNNIGLEQHVTETKRFINAYNENNLINNYNMFSKNVVALDEHLSIYDNDKRPILQPQDIRDDISLENYLNQLSIRLKIGIKGLESEEKWANELIRKIDIQLNLKK
ncbi:DUF6090 family protein [Psychroserpens sp. Hel_I_66]|uniref:DUF6090 family protein n=1 Tax=Psychroserpens sp. Hel_I_66 TaxID=1250004 RepID=UPI00068D2E70|nr:DUF6090 family protein [Psychroserpens sp. Hel_I_66]